MLKNWNFLKLISIYYKQSSDGLTELNKNPTLV